MTESTPPLEGMVRLKDLPELTSLSARTISRLRAEGKFPKPDRRTTRIPLWRAATIRRWQEGRGA